MLARLIFPLVVAAVSLSAAAAAIPPAHQWDIGPTIRLRNYSVGMPQNPVPAGRGWAFDFPYPHVGAGHVHYVTFSPGPLLGKSRIVARYRVDAGRGSRFVPQESPGVPATVSLFFQRRGDSWSGKRRYEWFRWYAPPQTVRVIAPGVHEISVSLHDPNWVSVQGRPAAMNPQGFREALAETERMGLVFGSAAARGHGVFATGPARFTLLDFRVI